MKINETDRKTNKKKIPFRYASFFLLLLPLVITACGSQKIKAGLFPEETASVQVIYSHAAESVAWELEAEETEAVRGWAEALELKHRAFEEGSTPGDTEGGASWEFVINGGEASFTYVVSGDGYLIFEDEWYEAENPSDPPVEMRVVFAGRTVKKAELSEETLEWLEWYNSLSGEEQLAVSYVPGDLLEAALGEGVEAAAVETEAQDELLAEDPWEPLLSLEWGMSPEAAAEHAAFTEDIAPETASQETDSGKDGQESLIYGTLSGQKLLYGVSMEVTLIFDGEYGLVELNAQCEPEEVEDLGETLTELCAKEEGTTLHMEEERLIWQTEPVGEFCTPEDMSGYLTEAYGESIYPGNLDAAVTGELGKPLVSCTLYLSGEREGTLCLDARGQAHLKKWTGQQ